jgi:Transposase IS66 family
MGYGRLLGRIPGRSGLADAIRYTLSRSPALRHFLDDGRIELDNNSVERAIRPSRWGARIICSPVPMVALTRTTARGHKSARARAPKSETGAGE